MVNPLQRRSPAGEPIGDRIVLRPRRRARPPRMRDHYLNVDYPPEHGVASGTSRPDLEADVTRLDAPPGSIAEVRRHHLFEHFARASALAMPIRWYDWLEPSGKLFLETPDLDGCIAGFASHDLADQRLILRHLFGSQEAPWAAFRWLVADPLRGDPAPPGLWGWRSSRGTPTSALLSNVTCQAIKPTTPGMPWQERVEAAREILKWSMNGDNQTERELLGRWEARLYEAPSDHRTG